MKTNLYVFSRSIVPVLFFSGCTQGPMNGSPQGWGHMMGTGYGGYGYGGMFMWLIWILIAGLIIYFIFDRSKNNKKLKDSSADLPIEILKRRYARGEIAKEEFDRMKKEIES